MKEDTSHNESDIKDDKDISKGLILDKTSETPITPSVELINGKVSKTSYNYDGKAEYEILDVPNEEIKEHLEYPGPEDNVSQFEENNGVRILNAELAEIEVIQEYKLKKETLQKITLLKIIKFQLWTI